MTLLKKVTIQGSRGGSPRRPGRAGKLAGRWGSYASRAAPTVGVGGARQRLESAWVPWDLGALGVQSLSRQPHIQGRGAKKRTQRAG